MILSNPVVDCLIKASIFACGILVSLLCMRRSSAAARHTVLRFGFLGLVLLPIFKLVVPGWVFPLWTQTIDPSTAKVMAAALTYGLAPTVAEAERSLAWVWLFGFAYVFARILSGLIILANKKRTLLTESNPRIDTLVKNLLGDRDVKVMFDPENHPPMTWGFVHPIVMLPTASFSWNEKRLKSVVEHELAHVDRSDWLNLLLAKLISALYWFHPLVWVLERRLNTESEKAADDRALETGCKPVDYAYHLLETARSHSGYSNVPGLAMGRPSRRSGQLRTRLTGILAKDRVRKPLSNRVKSTVGVCVTALACLIATANPKTLRIPDPVIVGKLQNASSRYVEKSESKPMGGKLKLVHGLRPVLKTTHPSMARIPVIAYHLSKPAHRHTAHQKDDMHNLMVLSQAELSAPARAEMNQAVNQAREEIIAQANEIRKVQQQQGSLDSKKITAEVQELASKLATQDLKKAQVERPARVATPDVKVAPESLKAPPVTTAINVVTRNVDSVAHFKAPEVHLDFTRHHSKNETGVQVILQGP